MTYRIQYRRWYEQKAVIASLALLYLGVRNIQLRTDIASVLVAECSQSIATDNFGIAGIGSVDEDMELFLGE